ncbi:c-type cytochrome [Deferribacteraceae bacterium V6Fe1]|nr:c-type cytochrome [Deferribacteraceae bacterium V6Fe1]
MKVRFIFLVFLFLIAASFVFAETYEKRIVIVCAGCHGTNGASVGDSIPIIGGQKASYLKKVMMEYKNDKKVGSVMPKIAKGYHDERIDFVANYFSNKQWVNTNKPFDKNLADKGKKIADVCYDCHGKLGEGIEAFPRIAGQPVFYLKQVLFDYKNGVLKSDEMSFVSEYSDVDLEALANYFSSIRR